jgi:pectin methylesterase-like acyl-CoA thioesterase
MKKSLRRTSALTVCTVLFGVLSVVTQALPAQAATLCVNTGGTGGCYATIQVAVNAASSSDTINVAAGTYAESVTVNKDVTIVGVGKGSDAGANTIISPTSGSAGFTIITAGAGATIQNLRIVTVGAEGVSIKAANGVTLDSIDIEKTGPDNGAPGIFIHGTEATMVV